MTSNKENYSVLIVRPESVGHLEGVVSFLLARKWRVWETGIRGIGVRMASKLFDGIPGGSTATAEKVSGVTKANIRILVVFPADGLISTSTTTDRLRAIVGSIDQKETLRCVFGGRSEYYSGFECPADTHDAMEWMGILGIPMHLLIDPQYAGKYWDKKCTSLRC